MEVNTGGVEELLGVQPDEGRPLDDHSLRVLAHFARRRGQHGGQQQGRDKCLHRERSLIIPNVDNVCSSSDYEFI